LDRLPYGSPADGPGALLGDEHEQRHEQLRRDQRVPQPQARLAQGAALLRRCKRAAKRVEAALLDEMAPTEEAIVRRWLVKVAQGD